jgi:predicted transcriptional regulator
MKKTIKFTFRPGKKGIQQIMGELEEEVMDFLWNHRKATVKDVFETLSSRRKIAYTTIITVMNRLADKNILRREKTGKFYVFEPIYNREEYKEIVSDMVVRGLREIDGEKAMAAFVDSVSEDPEELKLLEKLIEEKKSKR